MFYVCSKMKEKSELNSVSLSLSTEEIHEKTQKKESERGIERVRMN